MKKILIAALLVIALAGASYAADINNFQYPKHRIVPATATLDTFSYAITAPLPNAFIMFNGPANEFWLRTKPSGTWETEPTGIPGNIIIPAWSPERVGDTYLFIYEIYSPADTLTIYPAVR